MKTVRQGDLLITQIENMPNTTKRVKTDILLRGEATGHVHRIVGGDVFSDNGLLYFQVKNKADLIHEEHKTIHFPRGKYSVIRQREYISKDMVKVVTD